MSQNEIQPSSSDAPLELQDVVVVETNDGEEIEFEVVGIVEDDEGRSYAICYASKLDVETPTEDSEGAQPFIVTDAFGQLVRDPELAQSVLDDFLVLASEEEDALETQAEDQDGDVHQGHGH